MGVEHGVRQADGFVGHLCALGVVVVTMHQLVDTAMPIDHAQAHATGRVAQSGNRPQHTATTFECDL